VGSQGLSASRAARRRSALTSAAGRCSAATSRPGLTLVHFRLIVSTFVGYAGWFHGV
jgi:hypothetical protein